ncbi:MAG: adenylate/guanylate cyclase domain-containing protein [Thermoplasmata archaeon]
MADGTRRLAAIMFTDLVGFTRLGQRDEEAALRLRKEHQILVRPLFAAHGGREVKSLGDGFLVEFPSAVESVRCAVAIQQTVADRNRLPDRKERIDLRIGIHLGDVVEEGGDILGDAVNVASRIEPLALPGGVCVSGSIFEQVRNKVSVPLEKLGPRELKNVELPMDIYRVVTSTETPAASSPSTDPKSSLRVAVLPFANVSPDAADEYFADGLTDELISQLSRIPTLRVIARSSVHRYKANPKSTREVAQDLGVRLVLEGSVRKAGNRLRITAQLVDPKSEEQLWSSQYDRPLDDIFSIQEDIAGRIATAISGHLSSLGVTTVLPFVRAAPDTQNMEAYTHFLRGRRLLGEKGSESTIRQAQTFFEAAVRLDPGFSRARVGVADCLLWLGAEGATPYVDSVHQARQELARALEQNENLAEAHSALAGLLLGEDDMRGSEREARRALELNPSLSDAYRWLAQLAAGEGRIDETVRLLEAAQRIDPLDVNIVAFLGRAYAYAGKDAEALDHWNRTKALIPFRTCAHMAEYYLGTGDYGKVEEAVREMERLRPTSVWTETYRGILAARRGDPEAPRRAITRLDERGKSGELTVFFSGFLHYALGEEDMFVACMEEAFRRHNLPLMELTYSKLYEEGRKDPRLLDLLRRQHELRLVQN